MAAPLPWWRRALWPHHVLRLEAGTRVAFIGRPGSGKTTLQRWLLADVPSALIYDTKLHPQEWSSEPDYRQVHHPAGLRRHARAVLRVPVDWLRDTPGWKAAGAGPGWNWTLALEEPMRRGETVVLFDEALNTLPSAGGHDGAHRLFQQGRAWRVTVMVGNQLANNMDTRVLRTAEHLICFQVIHETDLEEIERARGISAGPLQVLRRREFAWHHDSEHRWEIFRPINPRRAGHVTRRRNVPPGPVARAGSFVRARWYLGRWLRRGFLPMLLGLAAWLSLLIGATSISLALLAFTAYVLARRWRGDRWTVDVECGPAPVPAHEPAPLALPAYTEPWRLKIPGRREASR